MSWKDIIKMNAQAIEQFTNAVVALADAIGEDGNYYRGLINGDIDGARTYAIYVLQQWKKAGNATPEVEQAKEAVVSFMKNAGFSNHLRTIGL